MLQIDNIRKDFPILNTEVNGRPLIYLDNAATTQIPSCVRTIIDNHYKEQNANVHRGIHYLSEQSTVAFEKARDTIKGFLNAKESKEIIITGGTTDSINIVASGLKHLIGPEDHIVVSQLEHHSNFLPWQRVCVEQGASFDVIPCPDGEPDMGAFRELLDHHPKVVAITQASNLTGTAMPIEEMIQLSHEAGALVLIDGAQGIRHSVVDVQKLDCDFYCFSGHKILGPTGVGALYGKEACLEMLEPLRVGGGMVDIVSIEKSTYGPLPSRLEAGTPNYAAAIGLGEALRYIEGIGRQEIADHEQRLIELAEEKLSKIEGLHILGNPKHRSGAISMVFDGVHPYDAASVVDKLGIAMRSGNHCAQPALAIFGKDAALRLSVAFYNTEAEIEEACKGIERMMGMFLKWMK